jgi:hypothetical protein
MANRSENTYQKINTLYKRDANNIIMQYDNFVDPVFEFLRNCKWDANEKVDGTNIRIEVTKVMRGDNTGFEEDKYIAWHVDIKGKSDSAVLPKSFVEYANENLTDEKILNSLGLYEGGIMSQEQIKAKGWVKANNPNEIDWDKIPNRYTIYGEGYGVGIQKVGSRYISNGASFIGFDVKVNDLYLLRDSAKEVFEKLGVPMTPYKGQMTIDEAIEMVRKGFLSEVSEDKTLIAEGLVLTTPIGLKDRNANRIIVKIKHCDYEKYRNKYGTDDPVEQPINTKYKS